MQMDPEILDERAEHLVPAWYEVRLVPESYDPGERTVEFVFSTGAAVRRYSYYTERWYDETLSMEPEHIRLDRINSGRAPCLESHNRWDLDAIVGSVVAGSVRVEGGQLIGRVRFHQTDRSKHLEGRVQRGELCVCSIGYQTFAQEVYERDGTVPERRAVDWEPYEVSLVSTPADAGAAARSAPTDGTHECRVRTVGAHRNDMDDDEPNGQPGQTTDTTRSTGGGASTPPPAGVSPAEAQRQAREAAETAVRAERERVSTIRERCSVAGLSTEFADGLAARGVTVDEARDAIIDEVARVREQAPAVQSFARVGSEERTRRMAGMEAALDHRLSPFAREADLEEGAREFRNLSLLELGMELVTPDEARRLRALPTFDRAKVLMGRTVGGLSIRGGMHSSSDFTQLLANSLHKRLRMAYAESEPTWRLLVGTNQVPDFKEVKVLQLGEAPQLKAIKEGGEYTYGTMGEAGEAYSVVKYGRAMSLTWEAVVNDDLRAFDRIMTAMGRQVSNLESDLFYVVLTANAAMADGTALFHADHGNLGAGVIATTGLNAMRVAMRTQKGLDGTTHLNIRPKFIVAPVALETTLQQQLVLATVPTTAAETRPFQGSLTPITDPRLDDDSAAKWYAFADPRDVDTIEYATLRGYSEPTYDFEEGFDVDGQKMKVRHVCAFKAIDHRGMYLSSGV